MDKTMETFLEILKSALKNEKAQLDREISPDEWRQLFQTAGIHNLLPMFYEAVYDTPTLPKDLPWLMAVKNQAMRQVVGQTLRTTEFLELNRKLQDNGITPLVVKGIICRELYPKLDHRPSSDEDLLIPEDRFSHCHQILLNFGMQPGTEEEELSAAYEIPYRKAGSTLYIELHKSLFPPESGAYGSLNRFFEEVHDRPVPERIQGQTVYTLDCSDHLLYLICHAFKHFLHGGFGIRQVCDMVLFARKHENRICWEQLQENCERIRAAKFAEAMFAIGKNHLGVEVKLPQFWKRDVDEMPMLDDLLDAGIFGGADMDRKHSSTMTLHAVARQKQGKDAGGGVAKSLFPKAASLEGRYPYLKKHPWLLPVAWVSRMVKFAATGGSDGAAKTVRIGKERIELLKQYEILEK